MEIAVLALGCFWGPEIKFDKLEGITKTEVGYCGGNSDTTTYEKILQYFFEFHNPTTLNAQGPDIGTQYRSEIFYLNEYQMKIAKKIIEEKNKKFSGKVVTKLSKLNNYCKAEDYHQKYLEK